MAQFPLSLQKRGELSSPERRDKQEVCLLQWALAAAYRLRAAACYDHFPTIWMAGGAFRLVYVTHRLALVRSANIDTGSCWLRRLPAMISFEKIGPS
jgi:hypothetical protein